MVQMAERNTDGILGVGRNGRRSRGPSPNGHGSVGVSSVGLGNVGVGGNGGGTVTPDTSSDDDNSIKRNGKSKTKQSEYEEKIRVGRDYQAVCPPLIPEQERKPEVLNDRALLVWSPTKEIPDSKLEEYISVAKEKYGYNGEQALGMLFWHKHDLERAVMDLANFTPFPDEWTVEDKVLFEQAFQFHGKSFHRIRQMLPDKSIASLVKYYYSWKKTRHRQSVMDRQEKAKASKEGSENGSDNGSNEESDNDEKVQFNKKTISALKKKNAENIEEIRTPESINRINARWTNDEVVLGVECVRKFGKDFQAIAETLGTKTEAHVRTFYLNYRRRYNLDQLVKQYEAEKEASVAASNSSSTIAGSSSITDTTNNIGIKKDDTKKKDIVISCNSGANDESDNPTSRDSSVSKSLNSDDKANDSNSTTRKDNVIVEIDLDAEQNDPPPSKKFALNVTNQDYPKSSVV